MKGKMMFGMKQILFTEDEYRDALKRFLDICDAEDGTPEADELEQLITIMEIYEQEHCP
jgi:HTH-type transcriptional regulator/antitoxin HigA